MTACGCLEKRDRSGWHRYHEVEMCAAALAHQREKGRRKYARARARVGATVRSQARPGWVAGTPIDVPEVDAL